MHLIAIQQGIDGCLPIQSKYTTVMFLTDENKKSQVLTVASVTGSRVGASSGMPIPKIEFSFKAKAWFTDQRFIAQIADRVPTPPLSFHSLAKRKQREVVLQTIVDSSCSLEELESIHSRHEAATKRFWCMLGQVLRRKGGLDKKQVKEVEANVKHLIHRRKMKKWREQYGIVQRGNVESGNNDALLPFQPGVVRIMPNPYLAFVPPLDVREYPRDLLARLQHVESKLKIVLRLRGGFKTLTKDDTRDANLGMSLARTTVTGGTYSNSNAGVSGSIHMNRNLTGVSARVQRQCALEGVDVHDLQNEVVDVLCDIIENTYGKTRWYIAAKDKIRNIPKIRLLPGARIPATHIWWTSFPETFHVHTDANTIPPAFVVCANEVKGGELCCLPPSGGVRVVDTKPGTIVGGSWAQYPHCNAPVLQGERHSFVVYLDNRHVSTRYCVMMDK